MFAYQQQRVLVTAGASGIGRCIAAAFLAAGARLHVADQDAAALAAFQADFPAAHASAVDVADAAQVDELFARHQAAYAGLEVLVNCAGIQGPTAAVEAIALADWRRCLAVNLDATFLCSQRAIPLLKANPPDDKSPTRGNIINISSTAGWHGYPLRAPYAAAKWAVLGFTKSLAMELGEHAIRVNAICPGSVQGERMERVMAAEAAQKGCSVQTIRRGYTDSCTLKTFIAGEDVANMALFLASPAAAKVTGQAMNVDGHLESFAVAR